MNLRKSFLSEIGRTPIFRIARLHQRREVELYVKAEWFNPTGSVKDRPAISMVREGLKSGKLVPGKVMLDATSGNIGISYAAIGAHLGYTVQLAIPASASPERMKIIRAFGAEMTLTDPLEGSDGAIKKAREVYAEDPDRYFYPNQYGNPENWKAHYRTTGLEVFRQTSGRVTHLVAGVGTGGTLMGAGRRLRELKSDIQLCEVQPDSPLHGLEGLKHMGSAIVPEIYDARVANRRFEVRTEDAQRMTKELARKEGLLAGTSSGAALVAALNLARELERGVIVAILPDGGERYLSERYWEE